MNVDTVPLSFGLTRENLKDLRLVWQGRRVRTGDEVDSLLSELWASVGLRGWSVAACMLAINFGLAPAVEAFKLAFSGIAGNIRAARPLRSDELRFLARVVTLLSERNEMPFLSVIDGLNIATTVELQRRDAHNEALRPLHRALADAEEAIVRKWEQTWILLRPFEADTARVEFTFDERPSAELADVLRELQAGVRASGSPPQLLETRRGSYLAILSMSVSTLMAFTFAVGMLVRNIDHLIILRAKWQVLTAPKLPRTIKRRALEPLPPASAELLGQLQSLARLIGESNTPLTCSGVESISSNLRQVIATVESHGSAPSV